MGITKYPSAPSGIKSIQRGFFAAAGSISISAVNMSKTFVRSYSTGSAGAIATNSNESGTLNPVGGSVATTGVSINRSGSAPTYSGTRTFSGGTTNFYSKEYGVYLSAPTVLTSTGPCRWEVIESY